MKEFDDTEIDEDATMIEVLEALTQTLKTYRVKIEALEKRIANLETQRTPADANMDDPEWY